MPVSSPVDRITRSTALFVVLAAFLAVATASAAPKRALFDNTHAETAGNADWQIDTDQPLPVPDQSTVTPATPRTYWLGAISSWAIDLVKRGYQVATLTSAHGITYGNGTNPYDLSNYDVFIVDEPNKRFTSAESTAVFNFVGDGGGLVAVSDHLNSDRDGDGIDSPRIWNALDPQHLWGVSFDVIGSGANFSDVYSTNVSTAPDDSIIFGPNGVAGGLEFHGGASMTLYPSVNPTVRGSVWRTGFAQGSTDVMAARSVYGNGRIFFVGDSSPADDGSATPGNSSIFDGWAEAAGNDSLIFLNGTMWVTRRPPPDTSVPPGEEMFLGIAAPNPARNEVRFSIVVPDAGRGSVDVLDVRGARVRRLARGTLPPGRHDMTWDGLDDSGSHVPAGVYFVRMHGPGLEAWRRVVWVR